MHYCVPDCRVDNGACTNGKSCDESNGGCDLDAG
jgi:hypothetical protein